MAPGSHSAVSIRRVLDIESFGNSTGYVATGYACLAWHQPCAGGDNEQALQCGAGPIVVLGGFSVGAPAALADAVPVEGADKRVQAGFRAGEPGGEE